MFNFDSIKLQYYMGGIRSNTPNGIITLRNFIDSHVSPKKSTVSLIDKIREASEDGDKARKTQLKENLPFITPSILVHDYRRYDNIRTFTELAQLDFDGIDNAIEFKEYLFDAYEQIVCCYISPSKRGVKALIRIPEVNTVEEYQSYYSGIEDEFENFDGFDSSPKNAVLPLFFSYDYFLRVRENPTVWDIKIEKETEWHKARPTMPVPYKNIKSNWGNKERTIKIFSDKIRDINSGTGGHPNVRSASLVLGTRVGAGYISYFDAVRIVETEISSNPYLSKGTAGYIKTGIWGIEKGMRTPKNY